jgi:hypothetical protein
MKQASGNSFQSNTLIYSEPGALMGVRDNLFKFAKEIGISSVKMAIATEVSKGIQKGAKAVFVKAAELSGMAKPEKSDVPETVFIDQDIIDQK